MAKIAVCILTFNSSRLLHEVLSPLMGIADEWIVVQYVFLLIS